MCRFRKKNGMALGKRAWRCAIVKVAMVNTYSVVVFGSVTTVITFTEP